ncbi:MAG: hypothetical protein K2P40_14650 [Lachnospiraceae bacterium]|nr:hypothetical protein [Lachnospiraceae bacterium]MDE6942166.1 hypothetical protein [Lachnospiraceae bacterium]MDE6990562.1 hypothetical protein [Lachnospiraceae bacterium]MDE7000096.1 hypothetical protein [Lachnospiraceae bacterium]
MKWHTFEDLTAKCYKTLDNGDVMNECWYSAFDTLLEIMEEERLKNPDFFGELADIDQKTENKYNVQGWVDDYFKKLSSLNDYDRIYKDGLRLIDAFQWQKQSSVQIRMRVVNAMERLGMYEAANRYSEEWVGQEPDDMNALFAALIFGKQKKGQSES